MDRLGMAGTVGKLREALSSGGAQAGAFDTTFVDGDVRVSRGDRGELRVFVR